MKIRLLKATTIDGKKHPIGQEMEVTLARGRELVGKEKAVEIGTTKDNTNFNKQIERENG